MILLPNALFGNLFGNKTRFGHGQFKSNYSILVPEKGTGFLQSTSSADATEKIVITIFVDGTDPATKEII